MHNKSFIFNADESVITEVSSNNYTKIGRHAIDHAAILPEILFITSYPPMECGIATYSQDLLKALDKKYRNSFSLKVCALESGEINHDYPDEVKYILNTTDGIKYAELSQKINMDSNISFVLIQHEFGFFKHAGGGDFLKFLYSLEKSTIIVFHTVLPRPNDVLKSAVRNIANACVFVIVMTKNSAKILEDDYGISKQKIIVIAHGTHLVPHLDKDFLKDKYGLSGKRVLSTFGLLSSGKGIEMTLSSLPKIIKKNPDTLFLIIGKTHPSVKLSEGEKYRDMLEAKVEELNLQQHVRFINRYVPLQDLLEYLQLTDIYLFTSKDPNQAVSGTFSYAMSCACPIISTPIPQAREVLRDDTGIIVDFQNAQQLADGVIRLMSDESLRTAFSSSTLQRIVPTAWENSAISHAQLFQKLALQADDADISGKYAKSIFRRTASIAGSIALEYRLPAINLEHLKKLTTEFGIIQFSKINQPDLDSGYTLDDNARALIAMCMHFELTKENEDLKYIKLYLDFICFCQLPEGYFLNYVDIEKAFTEQNFKTNLADSNGRAIWALGYLISMNAVLPNDIIETAEKVLKRALPRVEMMHSTRAMAFAIKGLHYYNFENKLPENLRIIKKLADRMVQMYLHESEDNWHWYESYMTYANSIIPDAMLCAWMETHDPIYKEIAKSSFDFLLSRTFHGNEIKIISNKSWLQKGQEVAQHGEQPIDVAYTILAMNNFYSVFKEEVYYHKIKTAFNWFLGSNHLKQIIYNPCTGGCFDGLEEFHVNLNQGAESTLSYLIARLTIEKHRLEGAIRPLHGKV